MVQKTIPSVLKENVERKKKVEWLECNFNQIFVLCVKIIESNQPNTACEEEERGERRRSEERGEKRGGGVRREERIEEE